MDALAVRKDPGVQADPVSREVSVRAVPSGIGEWEETHVCRKLLLECVKGLVESEDEAMRCFGGREGREGVKDRSDLSSEVGV